MFINNTLWKLYFCNNRNILNREFCGRGFPVESKLNLSTMEVVSWLANGYRICVDFFSLHYIDACAVAIFPTPEILYSLGCGVSASVATSDNVLYGKRSIILSQVRGSRKAHYRTILKQLYKLC